MTLNAASIMNKEQCELMGDNHISTAIETPMRDDAFTKSDEEKNLTKAWQIMFNTDGFSSNGGQPTARLKQNADRVRPVRAF